MFEASFKDNTITFYSLLWGLLRYLLILLLDCSINQATTTDAIPPQPNDDKIVKGFSSKPKDNNDNPKKNSVKTKYAM